jgi:hypothetical protein
MRTGFYEWLKRYKGYDENTTASRISNVETIERYYGNLHSHFINRTYQQEVIETLEYSTQDERRNRENPSKIPIDGNIRNGLATYKSAVRLYQSFLKEEPYNVSSESEAVELLIEQKISLERDMEKALRRNIESLEPTLKIIDNGVQRKVDSGFIDITCEDNNGLVVIELKAGKADGGAIAQISGYMGDLQDEESAKTVRGILVAHDFDKRAKAAARVVPTLTLKKYSIEFKFMAAE